MTARLPRSPICSIVRESDNGLPEKVTDGAFALSRTFNDHGEVDGLDVEVAGAVYSYDLTRDDGGRIETRTETVAGSGSLFKYGYDPLGRLLTVTRDGNLVEEYRYDNNGNRTYQMNAQLGITGRTFTHSLEDHTLTAGSITYEFDADDNLAARLEGGVTTKYAYSTAGELLQVTLPDATVIAYVHDPLGRRIAKKVNGTTVEKYLWSGRTTLLAVYDGSDNLRQRFQYADDRMPFAMTMGSATYYLAYDQVGSLRLVVDSGGSIVKRIEYDSFGNILSDSNPSVTIPLGFAGGLHDRETGLVRFGFRDYLPEIGKWTAKDPIDFAGGDSNLYGYVANDPVNFVDPSGLRPPSFPYQSFPGMKPDLANPFVKMAQKNIKAAESMHSPWMFKSKVQNKEDWDYKQYFPTWQDFGNYNFGATGAATGLFTLETLLREAGKAQCAADTSKPEWCATSNCDDPDDQDWIKKGWNDYMNGEYGPPKSPSPLWGVPVQFWGAIYSKNR